MTPQAPMAGRWEVTDEQWAMVKPVLREARRADNRGRPWHETRAVLNGVFLGAGHAECQLVEEVLAGSFLDELPARLIGDKAYDSDPLDHKLAEEYGIEMIAPNRRGRKRPTHAVDKLRRYRGRWKVERLFAWMHNFRRLVTRWEYHIENFLGFAHLACLHMMLRYL